MQDHSAFGTYSPANEFAGYKTPDEAAPLAAGLEGEKGRKGEGEALLTRILYWTGGHPYLTQRLCQDIAETLTPNASRSTPDLVDRLCTELFLTHRAREADDNLSFVRNRLLKSEADLTSLLELYGKVRAGRRVVNDETNPLCDILRLSGVCRVENGLLKVRNRIYERVFDREWVRTHLPDAELRRQRAARYSRRRSCASPGLLTPVLPLRWPDSRPPRSRPQEAPNGSSRTNCLAESRETPIAAVTGPTPGPG